MEQYNVTGMSCAACSARVEKAVSKVPGVTSCSVSLLTNSMGVEGTAAPADIVAAVEAAGYGASPKNAAAQSAAPSADALKDTETPRLKRRLIASLIFWVVLMYFSMGHMLWNWPLPGFMQGNHVAMGILQMLLTIIIMVINQKFFISGFKALWNRAPNMDTRRSGTRQRLGWHFYPRSPCGERQQKCTKQWGTFAHMKQILWRLHLHADRQGCILPFLPLFFPYFLVRRNREFYDCLPLALSKQDSILIKIRVQTHMLDFAFVMVSQLIKAQAVRF